ncbi:MAG TPA: electron transport complex subunit RsxB [Steroidobacteraceae bacterium]|nr:electron transport complex subunit RsxB [Steroidobacteraceae bacterium]
MTAVFTAVAVAIALAGAAGLLLGFAASRLAPREDSLVETINQLLPQTQCGQCTFPGCRPYAQALARGEADTNQCPPGGDATARTLAELLGREAKPVDPRFGDADRPRAVALIDEETCIGCTLCIQACPVDAIAGAPKYMHTVIANECTGCELCLPPCPVDCIEMVAIDGQADVARHPRPLRRQRAAA